MYFAPPSAPPRSALPAARSMKRSTASQTASCSARRSAICRWCRATSPTWRLEIDAAALLVYRAAWTKDTGAARVTREAAMAKLYATEAAQRVIDAAVQLHGGDGVRSGHPVESLYREIRALRIYEGASDVQKVVIARSPSGAEPDMRRQKQSKLGPSAHVDTFTRDNLPPAEHWPDLLLDRPEFQYPDYLNAGVELTDRHGRARLRRPHRADRQRPPPHLQGTGRLVESPCPCAGRKLRRQARQPRADPLRQQSGAGRGVAGSHQGRRGRRQHHADVARGRTREDRRQGRRSRSRSPTAASPTNSSPARKTAAFSSRSSVSTARRTTTPNSTASRSTSR